MQALANSYWFWLLLAAVLAVVYFLPMLIGVCRGVDQLSSVVVLNVVGGVTGIGWLGALILACGPKRQHPEQILPMVPEPEYYPVLSASEQWRGGILWARGMRLSAQGWPTDRLITLPM